MKILFLSIFLLICLHQSVAFLGLNHLKNMFAKDKCPIQLYDPKDKSFVGHKLYANVDTFHPLLRTLSQYAKQCRIKLNIKQSFVQETQQMSTLMLRDHNAMSFRLGEAIEFELVDEDNHLRCNRNCMEKSLSRLSDLPDVQCFLRKLRHDSNFRQDSNKPTILFKQRSSSDSLVTLHDQRKQIQNKCAKLKLDQ